jgi:hypothetical protein
MAEENLVSPMNYGEKIVNNLISYIPVDVRARARKIVKSYIEQHENGTDAWPEDEWVSIGKYFDLNMYTDYTKKMHYAAIYPVVNGKTNTKEWYAFYEKEYGDAQKKELYRLTTGKQIRALKWMNEGEYRHACKVSETMQVLGLLHYKWHWELDSVA